LSKAEALRKAEVDQREIEKKKVQEKEAAKTAVDDDGWSGEQQAQMEAGMKEVPSSLPTKERWIKIAEQVDGKTPKECFIRFRAIVAKLKA